jgi:hypothetical protein
MCDRRDGGSGGAILVARRCPETGESAPMGDARGTGAVRFDSKGGGVAVEGTGDAVPPESRATSEAVAGQGEVRRQRVSSMRPGAGAVHAPDSIDPPSTAVKPDSPPILPQTTVEPGGHRSEAGSRPNTVSRTVTREGGGLSVSPLPPGEGPGVRGVAPPTWSEPANSREHSSGYDPHPGPLPGREGGRQERRLRSLD